MNNIQQLRAKVKSGISGTPALFVPAFRVFGPSDKQELLIANDSEIVIEGFPRSANTFSVVAFQRAQNRPVRIAHHLHAEAQVLCGVERGLPILTLVRHPIAAVKSLKLIFPHIDENRSLRRWMAFYLRVERVIDRVVIADFKTVTSDYGKVLEAVNARFDTDFGIFQHTQKNVDAVYGEIESISRRLHDGSTVYVARPSDEKKKALEQIRFGFDPGLIDEVEAIYSRLSAISSETFSDSTSAG